MNSGQGCHSDSQLLKQSKKMQIAGRGNVGSQGEWAHLDVVMRAPLAVFQAARCRWLNGGAAV